MPSASTRLIASSPAAVAGLDQQVGSVHDLPQLLCLCHRGLDIVSQSRIDLDRYPPVYCPGSLVHRRQDVAGGTDIVGGDGLDHGVHLMTSASEVADLLVVRRPARQRGVENRRVRRHPDHRPGLHQFREASGGDEVPGQVVEPDRHPGSGQLGKLRILGHRLCS